MALRNAIWEIRRLLIWIATLGGGSGLTYVLTHEDRLDADEEFCDTLETFDYIEGEDYDDGYRCNDYDDEYDYYDDY